MTTMQVIERTEEYLKYLRNHIEKIYEAFDIVKDRCKDMRVIWDENYYDVLEGNILVHDMSKLVSSEFTAYRGWFYPVDRSEKKKYVTKFRNAWRHHLRNNYHHHETIGGLLWSDEHMWEVYCMEMAIDWIAMALARGTRAIDWYEENMDSIRMPMHMHGYIMEVFRRVYG